MSFLAAALALFGKKPQSNGNGSNGSAADASEPKYTILVIDDDATFLDTMRILLKGAGYNVLTSNNGPKGLDMMRFAPHGVRTVLLDFNMPGFNGDETLQFLRKLNPNVKVIAVSGFKANDLPQSFQKGVNRLLAKPFSNGELLETIEEVMGINSTPTTSASAGA